MLILAVLIAVLVDALAITALVAVLRRSDTTWLRISAIVGTTLAVISTGLVASIATVPVQTRIVMYGMARQEPTATILSTSKDMRIQIAAAVNRGLRQEGSKVDNVKQSVTAVLQPYMKYRLKTAPDRFVIASARATAAMLAKAKAEGTATCTAVLSGDLDTMRRLADPSSGSWLPDMLRAPALDDVRTATSAQLQTMLGRLAIERGWNPQDVSAATARRGPLACDLPMAVMNGASTMPEAEAAAMLRALGYGGQAVAAR